MGREVVCGRKQDGSSLEVGGASFPRLQVRTVEGLEAIVQIGVRHRRHRTEESVVVKHRTPL